MTAHKCCLLLLVWIALSRVVGASTALPEPLTLQAALDASANAAHFDLIGIDERLRAVEAELGIGQGERGLSLDLTTRLRQVGPSEVAPSDDPGDSAASLIISKPLYDFGLESSKENMLALQLQALEIEKQELIEQRRLSILQKYFAVLNADNEFNSENEALATGFIRYDRARQNRELGLVAQIDVLRLQSDYEAIRQKRYLAEHQQRMTRSILAEEMGYPDHPPSELEVPAFELHPASVADVNQLLEHALQQSLSARLMQFKTRVAQSLIRISQAQNNPSLDFEIELSTYERESSTRDDWRVSLYFEMPLYSQTSPAKVNFATAQYNQAVASQQHFESKLRLQVLQLWQEIQQTRLRIEGNAIAQNYRELYLDRSRAEYELEFKTDLGDSMVEFSRSNAERLKAVYAHELAYRKLVSLVGEEILQR